MLILGIESSCDDTAAAVLDNRTILSNVLSSQDDIHTRFGGVVPELASRTHLKAIQPIVDAALKEAGAELGQIDLIAATQGPGLIGSLLVGFSYAKALSYVCKTPLIGVDHMAGHLLSVFLGENPPSFPFIGLIVSGGTSSIFLAKDFTTFKLLGRTRDDAAGEAFDKVAKLLDLPYPGGPQVAKRAAAGDRHYVRFPRAWLAEDSLDFSFSGLKTAVLNHINILTDELDSVTLSNICASFQEAVIDVLIEKTVMAARQQNVSTIVIGGGVSANLHLRDSFATRCEREKIAFFAPQPQFSTDNAAMIAFAGLHKYMAYGPISVDQDVYSRSSLG